jgi:hypothetical protein
LPGATAEEVERLIVNPLEDGIKGVADVRFVISNARENVATMLVRFREIDERTFDKRMNDLRREIQNKHSGELPKEAKEPRILEITTSNGFPTASLLLLGQADDETLRAAGRRIKTDLERLNGVDVVFRHRPARAGNPGQPAPGGARRTRPHGDRRRRLARRVVSRRFRRHAEDEGRRMVGQRHRRHARSAASWKMCR